MFLASSDITKTNQNLQKILSNADKQIFSLLLNVLPTNEELQLQEQQNELKECLNSWSENVRPSLYQTNEDLLSISNSFASFYNIFFENAQKLENNPSAKQLLSQGLTIFLSTLKTKENNLQKAVHSLSLFAQTLTTNQSNINNALQNQNQHSAEILLLNQNLQNLNEKILESAATLGELHQSTLSLISSYEEVINYLNDEVSAPEKSKTMIRLLEEAREDWKTVAIDCNEIRCNLLSNK